MTAYGITDTVTAEVTGTVNLDRGNSSASPLFVSGAIDGTVSSKIADENGVYYTSVLNNNKASLSVQSLEINQLLTGILNELKQIRLHLESITGEEDPL